MLMALGMVAMAMAIGLSGWLYAPKGIRPTLWRVLRSGVLGAAPGILFAFATSDDFWLGLNSSAAGMAVFGSIMAVTAVAFSGEDHPPAREPRS